MTDHPLTDEMCKLIADTEDRLFTSVEKDNMRASADWQLERDAEFFAQYLIKHFGFAPDLAELRAEWFKEAMRPQQND